MNVGGAGNVIPYGQYAGFPNAAASPMRGIPAVPSMRAGNARNSDRLLSIRRGFVYTWENVLESTNWPVR